jgi:hypothetical protein
MRTKKKIRGIQAVKALNILSDQADLCANGSVNASVCDNIPPLQLDTSILFLASQPGAESIIVPPEFTTFNSHLCSADLVGDEDWTRLIQVAVRQHGKAAELALAVPNGT